MTTCHRQTYSSSEQLNVMSLIPFEEENMTKEQLLFRISIDPQVCFGKPCIRGHRIWVSLILDLVASGLTTAEI